MLKPNNGIYMENDNKNKFIKTNLSFINMELLLLKLGGYSWLILIYR